MPIKLKCEHCNKPINRADRCIKHTDTDEIFCSVDCAQEDNKKYLKEEAANDLIAMIECKRRYLHLHPIHHQHLNLLLRPTGKHRRKRFMGTRYCEEADEDVDDGWDEDEDEKRRIAIYGDSLL